MFQVKSNCRPLGHPEGSSLPKRSTLLLLHNKEARMSKPSRRNPDNPLVFLDITVGGEPVGRIVLELFKDVVPKVRRVD